MKKTVKVDELKQNINEFLKNYNSSITSPDFVEGQRVFLESILFSTGNYFGFRYLYDDEVPRGEKPGINRFKSEDDVNDDNDRFVNTDKNRVNYY
jgi:hypothetical protein